MMKEDEHNATRDAGDVGTKLREVEKVKVEQEPKEVYGVEHGDIDYVTAKYNLKMALEKLRHKNVMEELQFMAKNGIITTTREYEQKSSKSVSSKKSKPAKPSVKKKGKK